MSVHGWKRRALFMKQFWGRHVCLPSFWGFQPQSNLPPAVMNVFLPPSSVPSCYLSLSKTSSQLPTVCSPHKFPCISGGNSSIS